MLLSPTSGGVRQATLKLDFLIVGAGKRPTVEIFVALSHIGQVFLG